MLICEAEEAARERVSAGGVGETSGEGIGTESTIVWAAAKALVRNGLRSSTGVSDQSMGLSALSASCSAAIVIAMAFAL